MYIGPESIEKQSDWMNLKRMINITKVKRF